MEPGSKAGLPFDRGSRTDHNDPVGLTMKKALLFLAILGLSVSLSGQSLADLARKEKARRESFRGRHAVVIRNADLRRVQKVPGVEITYPDAESGGIPETEGQAAEPGAAGAEETGAASSEASPSEPPPETAPGDEPSQGSRGAPNVALEAQLGAARELVDLLKTKINSLRQQYEFQGAMVPGYVIQEQLVETEKRLLKAQAQLARIEAQVRGGGSR